MTKKPGLRVSEPAPETKCGPIKAPILWSEGFRHETPGFVSAPQNLQPPKDRKPVNVPTTPTHSQTSSFGRATEPRNPQARCHLQAQLLAQKKLDKSVGEAQPGVCVSHFGALVGGV